MENARDLIEGMKFIGERPGMVVGSVDVGHGVIWMMTAMILAETRQVPFGHAFNEACQLLRKITDPNLEHHHAILLGDAPPGSDHLVADTVFGERVARLIDLLERTELSGERYAEPLD
jgi:hypothetical protein